MTSHCDLDQLAAARSVRKTHGGATILSSIVFEDNFNCRARRRQEAKRALAARVASLIVPETTSILDDNTTTAAPEDCPSGHYSVVTGAFLGVDCEMRPERLRASEVATEIVPLDATFEDGVGRILQ
jgi:hypothetical protein